jgi:hypothetical protein
MFEKLTRQAEQVVSDLSVSRRGFLGRTGRGALAATSALAALLAAPRYARAGHGVPGCIEGCIDAHCGRNPTEQCRHYYLGYCAYYCHGQA